ncbi:MAG: glycosyltransferase [Planctomycetes bacterium]|nr:glycosyltransferase [Planctomycetota bacterium]
MYIVPIHVPIYVEGQKLLLASDWLRALRLLRDSLPKEFGELKVIAPSLSATDPGVGQKLEPLVSGSEGIHLVPSFDLRVSAKAYWLRHRRRWIADLEREMGDATVVHAGYDDVYRPIAYEGLVQAWKRGITSVFVQDTDISMQMRELARGAKQKLHARVYGALYDRACLRCVSRSDLSLLKGAHLMQLFGRDAKNPKEFHDTSFARADVVPTAALEARLATLAEKRPLRLVYCGRFEARKGLDHSIAIVRAALAHGADVTFDLIGDSIERAQLEQLARDPALKGKVRFLGSRPYGGALLRELAGYDALFFTPLAEDTPRMIFDGYAAGLPLVGYDIDYVRERDTTEHATVCLPRNEIDASARILMQIAADHTRLVPLSRAARVAAEHHSSESWYERRAQWTLEAHTRRHSSARRAD